MIEYLICFFLYYSLNVLSKISTYTTEVPVKLMFLSSIFGFCISQLAWVYSGLFSIWLKIFPNYMCKIATDFCFLSINLNFYISTYSQLSLFCSNKRSLTEKFKWIKCGKYCCILVLDNFFLFVIEFPISNCSIFYGN